MNLVVVAFHLVKLTASKGVIIVPTLLHNTCKIKPYHNIILILNYYSVIIGIFNIILNFFIYIYILIYILRLRDFKRFFINDEISGLFIIIIFNLEFFCHKFLLFEVLKNNPDLDNSVIKGSHYNKNYKYLNKKSLKLKTLGGRRITSTRTPEFYVPGHYNCERLAFAM